MEQSGLEMYMCTLMLFCLLASGGLAFSIYGSRHQTHQNTINPTGIWSFGGKGFLFIIKRCLITQLRNEVDIFYVNMSANTMEAL